MTDEFKNEVITEKENVYLNEQEIRALLSSELTNLTEKVMISGGYIKSRNYDGTNGFKIEGDGVTLGSLKAGSDPAIQGWGNTMTFSAVDADTVQWNAGTITLTDGTIYNISAGNTGNMSALTYIYFSAAASTTVLQTTTTQATAVGRGKIVVAVAQNNSDATSEATFQVFGGSGGVLLKADNIAANTITANEIAANTITASQMNVSQLSAITAYMGTLNLVNTTTGANIKLDSTNRRIAWIYDNNERGYIYVDSDGKVTIDADTYIRLKADGSGDDIWLDAGDQVLIDANDCIFTLTGNFQTNDTDNFYLNFNSDNTNAVCRWEDDDANDVLMELRSSDEKLYIDGGIGTGGADFAEMFEATKEFSKSKIQNGTTIVLVGDKIRPALVGEIPFGVISSKPTIIGNETLKWNDKYLKDDFENYVYEDAEWWSIRKEVSKNKFGQSVEKRFNGWSDEKPPMKGATKRIVKRKILNPNYDEKIDYKQRKERPEWNIVGLIGRVRILKGQPTNPNWIKLKDISNNVEEWLIK